MTKQKHLFFFLFFIFALCAAPVVASGFMDALRDKMNAPRVYDVEKIDSGFYDSNRTQFIEIYRPKGADDAPVLAFVPGHNWAFNERKPVFDASAFVKYWVSRGYLVAVIHHRMLPDAGPLEQARDVAKAVGYLQRNIGDVDGDGSRIALVGYGAGAHLVSLVGVAPGFARDMRAEAWRGTLVLDSLAVDVVGIMKNNPEPLYKTSFGKDPPYWELTSPYHQVNAGAPPFFLVCSTRGDFSCAQARMLKDRLDAVDVPATLLRVQKSHADIYATLMTDAAYADAIAAFLKKIGVTP